MDGFDRSGVDHHHFPPVDLGGAVPLGEVGIPDLGAMVPAEGEGNTDISGAFLAIEASVSIGKAIPKGPDEAPRVCLLLRLTGTMNGSEEVGEIRVMVPPTLGAAMVPAIIQAIEYAGGQVVDEATAIVEDSGGSPTA
jgi:hypothetical protein